jgi:hypothetical protein
VSKSKTGSGGSWGMKTALLAVVVLTAAGMVFHLAGHLADPGSGSIIANANVPHSGARSAAHPAPSSTSLSLPLFFEPNQGQTDKRVKFLARGAGYGLFLTAEEAVLSLQRPAVKGHSSEGSVIRMRLDGANSAANIHGTQPLPGKSNYFIGNDPSKWRRGIPQFGGVEYQSVYPGIDLVYYGNQRQLEYDFRLAPGADPNQIALSFKGASARMESGDLILSSAGGDIRFHAPHIYQPSASAEGANTEGANKERTIAGSFRQLADNKIGFAVGPYDHSRELVIDPVLTYSTYLGEGTESLVNVAIDAANNIYVAGSTQSAGFPVTAGALQTSLAGTQNIFVAVINSSATGLAQLLFATYLGGNGTDSLGGIAVDPTSSFPNINIYVAGTTTSSNFPPSSNAFQPKATFGPNQTHGFLSVVNVATSSTGNVFTLSYSTFLAGNASNGNLTENDTVTGLAVDSSFNAYVTGTTTSTDVITGFPSTPNAFQICPFEPAQAGGNPCPVTTGPPQFFASKINTAGSGAASMLYSTYFGGGYTDDPKNVVVTGGSIAVDPTANNANNTNVNMYFTGTTNMPGGTSNNGVAGFPLVNSFQSCLNQSGLTSGCTASTNTDAILVKLNPNLNQPNAPPVYSTYLGGSGNDNGIAVAVDTSSNAYVTGSTASNDWLCNNSCIYGPYNAYTGTGGNTNAYIAKVGNEGNIIFPLSFFTYIGGSGPDSGQAIAVDSVSSVHVAGSTLSANLPVVDQLPQNAGQGINVGAGGDAFVALISTTMPTTSGQPPPAGDYLTYLGGNGLDQGTGIALDVFNTAYVVGTTRSSNFPPATPANPLQGYNAPQDAFVTKLGGLSNVQVSAATPSPSPLPAGTQGTFTFDITNMPFSDGSGDPASNVIFEAFVPTSGIASLPTATVSSGAGVCSPALGSTIVCTIGTLAVNASAQVQVFVTPQSPAVGAHPNISVSGTVAANGGAFNQQAAGQTVYITDFAIAASPGSQTVQNGQLATFNIVVGADYPLGYNATVSLTQSSSPSMVTSPAPTFVINPVTLTGTTSAQTQLNIQTVARPVTTGSLFRRTSFYAAWLPIGGLSLVGLGIGAGRKRRRVLACAALGLVGGLILLQPACGSSSNPTTTTGGTAAGQYTITITGSASTGASHNTIVTLDVT